jgi:prepilin-type processing-associated H-X9-DG protein
VTGSGASQRVNTNLFICPSQKIFNPPAKTPGYMFSYSFNASLSSGYPDAGTSPYVMTAFKAGAIVKPANKFMFVEEPASLSPLECPGPGIASGTESVSTFLDDGKWEPSPDDQPYKHNLLGIRHNPSGANASGNVAFADGHAKLTPWTEGTNDTYVTATAQ